ncbi:MAG: UDP-N-acetylenolpyruvoylglucosamine reductase [Anaerolineaceae bacterium]|nr:UDP-N-acetylenolpyruvoylglucosamine reductase [Anaerolineaceae bacterium]
MTFLSPTIQKTLSERFGTRLKNNVSLAGLTTAQVGGPANTLITIQNREELAETARLLWDADIPFRVLGSGSNVLFSDQPYQGIILLNKAKLIKIDTNIPQPTIWAESGANFGLVARKAALAGLGGLEWAATIPGTIGGAVYGNAGAHGGNMAGNLLVAEILQQGKEPANWTCEKMEYSYRSSILKREQIQAIILSATFSCSPASPKTVQDQMQQYSEYRRLTQPPGASMGSMFKNPEGDYAGRLIEAAGLKGKKIGGVKVSEIHANFFVNSENATAQDIWQLARFVQEKVYQQFNVRLELEIEPVGFTPEGDFTPQVSNNQNNKTASNGRD